MVNSLATRKRPSRGKAPVSVPIPVYVFDEHNLAYYYWHKAKYEKVFKKPLDLFHIDAHEDMGCITKLDQSIYSDDAREKALEYHRKIAQECLGNGFFILPAVLNGLVKNVYFIFPQWRNCKAQKKQFNIASAFGEGKIIKHNLMLGKDPDPLTSSTCPDLTPYRFTRCPAEKMPVNRKVILDIDLDYFACRDTILNHMQYELEITKEQFLKRNETILSDNTLAYSGLDFTFSTRAGRYYATVSHRKIKEISHLPSEDEIAYEITKLVQTVKSKKVQPAMVTICRSSTSGYCPREYSRFIEEKLLQELESLYSIDFQL